ERVRAEHDPALRLRAEPRVACALDHLPVRVAVHPGAVADAVVARKVRRSLGRRDEVVARHAVVERERQGALPRLRPEPAGEVEGLLEDRPHTGLDRGELGELFRNADPEPVQPLVSRQLYGLRQLYRRRVARVSARDDRIEERAVADRPGDWSDLVEAR